MEETKVQLRDSDGHLTPKGSAAMNEVDDIMRPLFNSLLDRGFSREEVMYIFVSGAHECYLDDVYFSHNRWPHHLASSDGRTQQTECGLSASSVQSFGLPALLSISST